MLAGRMNRQWQEVTEFLSGLGVEDGRRAGTDKER
jgi:hypothetical protein